MEFHSIMTIWYAYFIKRNRLPINSVSLSICCETQRPGFLLLWSVPSPLLLVRGGRQGLGTSDLGGFPMQCLAFHGTAVLLCRCSTGGQLHTLIWCNRSDFSLLMFLTQEWLFVKCKREAAQVPNNFRKNNMKWHVSNVGCAQRIRITSLGRREWEKNKWDIFLEWNKWLFVTGDLSKSLANFKCGGEKHKLVWWLLWCLVQKCQNIFC